MSPLLRPLLLSCESKALSNSLLSTSSYYLPTMTPNNKSHRPREIPAEIPTPLQIQDAYKAGNHRRAAELAVIAYHHPPRPTVAAEQKQQLKELRAERGWVVVDVDVGGERLRVATWNFCPPAVVERPRSEGECHDRLCDQPEG